MSEIGIKRCYWKNNAWRYKCTDRQKALTGKSWIRLGDTVKDAQAEYARWVPRLFPVAGMAEMRAEALTGAVRKARIYAGERLPAHEGLVLVNMLEKALKESER